MTSRRRWRCLLLLAACIGSFAQEAEQVEETGRTPVPCSARRRKRCCGDGKCGRLESPVSCPEDCPGVTTTAMCGEEYAGSIEPTRACACVLVSRPALIDASVSQAPFRHRRPRSSFRHQPSCRERTGLLRPMRSARQESQECQASMQQLGLLPAAHMLGTRHRLEPHIWRVLAEMAGGHVARTVWPTRTVQRRVPRKVPQHPHRSSIPRALDGWRTRYHARPLRPVDDRHRRNALVVGS